MSDFDLNLIREFRSRPAFYDRSSPLFKDKALNAQAWQEISNNLGYDVALLKDRMLQLRNRYNLEKRRLEQLAEESPGKYVHSPWPLYEHLEFLSEHIRTRRSFKRMMPRQSSADLMNPDSGGASLSTPGFQPAYAAAPLANGMLAVKLEQITDAESDSQSGTELEAGEDNHATAAAVNQTDMVYNNLNIKGQVTKAEANSSQRLISIRSLDSMRNIIPKHEVSGAHKSSANTVRGFGQVAAASVPEKKRCLSAREQKYEAFGQFVASSLEEMPRQQALLLVERFTSEVVRVLIEKNATDDGSTSAKATPPPTPALKEENVMNNLTSTSTEEDAFQKPLQQQQQQQPQQQQQQQQQHQLPFQQKAN